MYLDDKTVFVAGATGLAGSAIVRSLLAASPTTMVRAAHRRTGGVFIKDDRVAYVKGDLRERADCARVVDGCDCAILAAAQTGGARAARNEPWAQVTDNVVMDSLLLEALHRKGIGRVVYVSSASVYQPFDGFITEDQLDLNQEPDQSYLGVGWAKRYIEKQCAFWHAKAGMEVLIGRAANIYGPYAKFDPGVSNFIAAIVRKAVDGMTPFEVWGSPNVIRDVLYADDFGRAAVAMMNHVDSAFDIFNIGSGQPTTVGDVTTWALEFSGHQSVEVRYSESEATTIPYRGLDCSKALRILGWQAEIDAREGVRRTLEWWRGHKDKWTR
jgi:nucleoside-diphosphate-sugar epimerase